MARGRNTVRLIGGGLALLALVVILNVQDLRVAYLVGVLRSDPSTMIAWIPEPDSSIKGLALRRYLRSPEGVHALRRRFVTSVLRHLAQSYPAFLPESLSENQIVQFGLYDIVGRFYLLVDGPTTLALPFQSESEVLTHIPLLEFAGSGDFELAEYPGVQFTIWTEKDPTGEGPVVVEVRMRGSKESAAAAGLTETTSEPGTRQPHEAQPPPGFARPIRAGETAQGE